MNIYCLADEDTVRGFRLAGIAGQAVTTPEQAAIAVNQIVTQPEINLLIITEQIYRNISGLIDTIRLNAGTVISYCKAHARKPGINLLTQRQKMNLTAKLNSQLPVMKRQPKYDCQ
jgi:vacuolar-type H+-ATPase subunit F/Vma7